jgi:hypothetical protein
VPLNPAAGAVHFLACPSVMECVGVSRRGDAVTFDPRVPQHQRVADIATGGGLTSLACPTVRQCTAVGSGGDAVTFDPRPRTPVKAVVIDPAGGGLMSIACPATRFCVAVDALGTALEGDPRASTPWTRTPFHGAATAISCLSISFCAGVDGQGDVFLGTSRRPPAPTRTQLEALLDGIAAHHAGASAHSLVKYAGGYGGYEFSVFVPAGGRMTIDWYDAGASAPRALSRRAPQGILVATTGRTQLTAESGTQLTLSLTAIGAKIFRRSGRVALVAQATLAGHGRRLVSSPQTFTMTLGG